MSESHKQFDGVSEADQCEQDKAFIEMIREEYAKLGLELKTQKQLDEEAKASSNDC